MIPERRVRTAAHPVTGLAEAVGDDAPRVIIRAAQPSDAFGITRAHVDTSRVTYGALLSGQAIRHLRFAAQLHCWQSILREVDRRVEVQVAEARGELVGFAAGGPARMHVGNYAAELYAIYVLPRHQRRGLGARLFSSVASALSRRGLTPMFLWVLANNPAKRFFERLGGRPVPKGVIDRLGQVSKGKIAYSWSALPAPSSLPRAE